MKKSKSLNTYGWIYMCQNRAKLEELYLSFVEGLSVFHAKFCGTLLGSQHVGDGQHQVPPGQPPCDPGNRRKTKIKILKARAGKTTRIGYNFL